MYLSFKWTKPCKRISYDYGDLNLRNRENLSLTKPSLIYRSCNVFVISRPDHNKIYPVVFLQVIIDSHFSQIVFYAINSI